MMLFSMIFAAMIAFNEAELSSRSDFENTITSKEEDYGDWSDPVYCNENQYAYKFEFKHEKEGQWDDTSANGVRLHCKNPVTGSNEAIETTSEKYWGNWFDTTPTSCPEGELIIGFKTKVYEVGWGTGDDTSLNCIQMKCSDGTILIPNECGSEGDYASKFTECDHGDYVCGLRERYEKKQNVGDDTALNAVRLECCSVEITTCDETNFLKPCQTNRDCPNCMICCNAKSVCHDRGMTPEEVDWALKQVE
eukprot:2428_1